jgi:hypothetical protein
MPMHDAQHEPRPHPAGHSPPQGGREQGRSGQLSQSDPEPEPFSRRPPIWLIIIALVFIGIIAMHVVGVGPSH